MTSATPAGIDPSDADHDPVVVTGIGLWTGLGIGRDVTWAALGDGSGSIRRLGQIDRSGERAWVGSRLKSPGRLAAEEEPAIGLVSALCAEALWDAGLFGERGDIEESVDPDRVAVLVGLSKGGVRSLGRLAQRVRDHSNEEDTLARLWGRKSWPSSGASELASLIGARGPCLAPIAACATGLVAAIQGADLIRRGACDVALVGAADASLEPIVMAAFRKMRVLARNDMEPSECVRPWDRNRSGFVVGEGGAILVLERASHARARGVLPYAEVAGGALGSDAYHETNLNPDPAGLAHLIGLALERSGLSPSDIDHINVHGTATRPNDPLECKAIRRAFGVYADRIACTANKAQIGHLLGAAGAAELAITCLSIRDQFVPPTLNLTDPDPECDLDGTPLVGLAVPIRAALKLSIGFGGHLAACVLRRTERPRPPPGNSP